VGLAQAGAHANDLAGDSRSLLVAFADGACQLFSWQGQVRGLRGTQLAFASPHAQKVNMQWLVDVENACECYST